MAFDISQFRAQLKYDGARPSQFEVQLFMPPTLQGIARLETRFFIRAASIPEESLTPISVPYFGRTIKVAGSREFRPWTVTVLNDEDFGIRAAFEAWSSRINSHRTNLRLFGSASPSEYVATARVIQYGKTGNIVRAYSMKNVWPIEIGAIPLDWSNGNQIEEYPLTFAYDWWEVENEGTSVQVDNPV